MTKYQREGFRALLFSVFVCLSMGSLTHLALAKKLAIPFEKYRLDNGMEVILHQDRSVPLVAVNVWYHVGAGDETLGKSGFAHLFEHMLFQGSENVGEDRHFAILKGIGASRVNGTTNFNRTNYFEQVPANQLETALWLESDRMGFFLPLLTQKSLDNQIEVVRNERRQRLDNVPYGKSEQKMFEALYPEAHPYRGMIIGYHKDLVNSNLSDITEFYKKWYTPSNATLTLAGDFDIPTAKKLVNKWFGSLPKLPKPAQRTVETPKISRSRQVVLDQFAKLRRLSYAWHTPARFSDNDAELKVLADILASSTGRLFKKLVHSNQLAQKVSAYQWSNQSSGSFFLEVLLKPNADLKVVEATIEQELSSIMISGVTAQELKRAVTQFESRKVWKLEHLMSRADALQSYNHFQNDPGWLQKEMDQYRAITPAKIKGAASKYLTRAHRAEILTLPIQKKVAKKAAKGGQL